MIIFRSLSEILFYKFYIIIYKNTRVRNEKNKINYLIFHFKSQKIKRLQYLQATFEGLNCERKYIKDEQFTEVIIYNFTAISNVNNNLTLVGPTSMNYISSDKRFKLFLF